MGKSSAGALVLTSWCAAAVLVDALHAMPTVSQTGENAFLSSFSHLRSLKLAKGKGSQLPTVPNRRSKELAKAPTALNRAAPLPLLKAGFDTAPESPAAADAKATIPASPAKALPPPRQSVFLWLRAAVDPHFKRFLRWWVQSFDRDGDKKVMLHEIADTLVPPQLAAAVHNPWAGVAGAVIMCTGTLYNVASAGFGTHHTALAALSLLNLLHQTATARRQSGIKAGALQVL
eukprot:TRINITY_DN1379_c0_g1_i2.p1 TRINITY_DN1379_c0_g1~~TRINITY_DN1379_c0_g1_i2.p1  ORF type:complete len:232 (-),score=26.65 TRINITY_DN1379_c0_g1_i2:702-1397(-)